MGFKCGIVGLPNVGKSTLFNCLSQAHAESANYPFCTIEPNVAKVTVPDARLTTLAELAKPEKTLPAVTEFVDIAGLVKGASQGQGLGNKFLAHIREVSVIIHVVRAFDDDNIIHVEGSVNPARDIEIIETELMLSDLDAVEKKLEKERKIARSGDKVAVQTVEHLDRVQAALAAGRWLGREAWDAPTLETIRSLHLLSAKPVLYVANVSDPQNPGSYVEQIAKLARERKSSCISLSARLEEEIQELPETERKSYLKELGVEESGLDRLIREGYGLLGLITYFTVGPKEVRAWTIPTGYTGPQAAGVIHSDFERGFICAETCSFEDMVKYGSEAKVRAAGLLRQEGRDYVVRDGDIMHFRFNV